MIAPQELRIGNLVEYDGKIFKVKEIRNYIIVCDRGKGNVDFTLNEISPIELSEEWFEKINFICLGKKRNWFDYILNRRVIFSISLDGVLAILLNGEFSNIGSGFKYVHQIQNLIFALTWEELTIKEQS